MAEDLSDRKSGVYAKQKHMYQGPEYMEGGRLFKAFERQQKSQTEDPSQPSARLLESRNKYHARIITTRASEQRQQQANGALDTFRLE